MKKKFIVKNKKVSIIRVLYLYLMGGNNTEKLQYLK